jgi:hypothetical protein
MAGAKPFTRKRMLRYKLLDAVGIEKYCQEICIALKKSILARVSGNLLACLEREFGGFHPTFRPEARAECELQTLDLYTALLDRIVDGKGCG